MRPTHRMPYHKSTAEILERDPAATPMTHNQSQAYVNGWRPKQPALFALNEVIDCPVAVFGRLPKGFLTRVALPWLKCARQEVLHVCSGSLREKYTVDIRPEVKPWLVADGANLPLAEASFAAALLDPPYVPAWARQYGTKYPPTYPLLREACRVVRPGGRIGILHFLVPFPPKNSKLIKVFGVSVGMGYQMRAFSVYEKTP